MKQALDVWSSSHCQWLGKGGGVTNIDVPVGKITGVNDFCIYMDNADANRIGKMVNLDGIQVDGGYAPGATPVRAHGLIPPAATGSSSKTSMTEGVTNSSPVTSADA